jgi:hypothetical protein
MRNHMFLHLSDQTISEFCTRWIELNHLSWRVPSIWTQSTFHGERD